MAPHLISFSSVFKSNLSIKQSKDLIKLNKGRIVNKMPILFQKNMKKIVLAIF